MTHLSVNITVNNRPEWSLLNFSETVTAIRSFHSIFDNFRIRKSPHPQWEKVVDNSCDFVEPPLHACTFENNVPKVYSDKMLIATGMRDTSFHCMRKALEKVGYCEVGHECKNTPLFCLLSKRHSVFKHFFS